jgi:hypothetical protein
MARHHHTLRLAATEEAVIVLFCLVDDAYALLNPPGRRYESLKRLSDSEVIALALFQQTLVAKAQLLQRPPAHVLDQDVRAGRYAHSGRMVAAGGAAGLKRLLRSAARSAA